MKRQIHQLKLALAVIVVMAFPVPSRADWDPTDPYKMHFPQEPDPTGWDVCLMDQWLADDFVCNQSGAITDIHIWFSWSDDVVGEVVLWDISIYDNDPANPEPNVLRWNWNGQGNFLPRTYGSGLQGWFCPFTGQTLPMNHSVIWQLNITDIAEPFEQTAGQTYWLVIRVAAVLGTPGWKTTLDPFQSPALWSPDLANWTPVDTEGLFQDLAFVITGEAGQDLEYGDAPEGTIAYPSLAVNGNFPTCITVGPAGLIQHTNFGALFGPSVDFEADGNAGFCPTFTPNQYDMDECFADGDAGLMFPDPYTIQGPVGAEAVVPCPNSVGTALGNTCQTASWGTNLDIDVHNHMPNSTIGYVNVLIDWDQNGIWAGSSQCPTAAAPEHVLVNFPIPNPGGGFDGPLSFLNPPGFLIGPNSGFVWARFTITEAPVPLPWTGDGAFEDGETEDYLLRVDSPPANIDFGDAPDPTYPTLLTSNGARHTIVPGYALGPGAAALIDAEPDGLPSALADGDDLNNLADEDGITFMTLPLIPGQQAIIDIRNSMGAGGIGYLEGWIDFNGDGSWAEAGDQIFFSQPLSPAPVNFDSFFINVPATATPNINTYARFRFSSNPNGYGFAGPATDGEVEDYIVPIGSSEPEDDLGDAPDSSNNFTLTMTAYPPGGPPGVQANYPTVFMDLTGMGPYGPIHNFPLAIAYLGPNVSLEREADFGPDQDPTNNLDPPADTPDLDLADDGVVFPLILPHCQPSTFDFIVTVTTSMPAPFYVNAWFDWTRDGDWDDTPSCPLQVNAPEWAVQNQLLFITTPGQYTITSDQFLPWHPTDPPDELWMRITLSEQEWQPAAQPGYGGSGPVTGYEYGETEDYFFKPLVREAKWSQLPHEENDSFDAASDFWSIPDWPSNAKWQQSYDSSLAALHAHDGPVVGQRIILANDWICLGGLVTDLHWWGGIEQINSGLAGFTLSIHDNDPQTCLPVEPVAWSLNVPIAQITVTNTGASDPTGVGINLYEYVLPMPFDQIPGNRYWFNVSAISNDPNNNVIWKWAQSSPAPILCQTAQKQDPTPGVWQPIPSEPIEMAFRITTEDPFEPLNKVVADDFISDGRAIETVRWWGSYLDERYEPTSGEELYVIDGWFISFHHEIPESNCPPDHTAGDDPTALGVYFAPSDAITITPMGYQDCLSHDVYEYQVDLSQCCLVCWEVDPRDGSIPAEADAFREAAGAKYWLDIQAVVGMTWQFESGSPCIPIVTGHIPPEDGNHFWGWHSSPGPETPCNPMNEACTGRIVNFPPMAVPDCWDYADWNTQPWMCPPPVQPVNMAFELITTEPDPCPCPGDVNGDGVVNGLDIQAFCDCILGNPVAPSVNCACCDFNCTKTPDIGDVSGFVAELLNGTVCP